MKWFEEIDYDYIQGLLRGLDIAPIRNRGKRALRYVKLYSGFDIETTTLQNHHAYMYVWQMSFNGKVVMGRRWNEFKQLISWVKSVLSLRETTRVIVWIANINFEFQFMRKHFQITDSFAKSKRELLYFVVDGCIEFRDCLAVSGGNLAYLARNFCTTQKLVGELDYSKERSSQTPLTDKEITYCVNDVVILSEYSKYIFDTYITPQKFVPLTKTGILRREIKKGVPRDVYDVVSNCYPDEELYTWLMQYVFNGGVTHANRKFVGKVLEHTGGVDITSSYPHVMLSRYYPVGRLREVPPGDLGKYLGTHCCIFDATFTNIKATTTHSIISKHKARGLVRGVFDNGRLIRAGAVRLGLTEVDYGTLSHFYEWDSCTVHKAYVTKRGKLPKYLIQPIANAYVKKHELKEKGLANTTDYMMAKIKVNSGYGVTVTRLPTSELKYSSTANEWVTEPKPFDEAIKNAFLLPQWGVYVTAHARASLLGMIAKRPDDVVYYDTDSIKMLDYQAYKPYVDEYNRRIEHENKEACCYYNIPYEVFRDIGTFDTDYEECMKFKTLGAKRYVYTDTKGGNHVTIAGLPKGVLEKKAKDEGADIYDLFADGLLMSSMDSGKLCSIYNDEPHEDLVDGVVMREMSSVGIFEIPFEMTIDTYYKKLIEFDETEDCTHEKRTG